MEATGSRLIQYGNKSAEFTLTPIADIHWGNAACCTELFRYDMKKIAEDPYTLWLIAGDYIDWITFDDKRFDPATIPDDFRVKDFARFGAKLIAGLLETMTPAKNTCLGVGYGNHDYRYMSRTGALNLHDLMCEKLESQNLMYSSLMNVYFEHCPNLKKPKVIKTPKSEQLRKPGQVLLRVAVSHGYGAAQTAGGKMMALKRFADLLHDRDLAIMGHLHEQISKVFPRMGADDLCEHIEETCCQVLMTGSYFRTYQSGMSSYGEMKGFAPAVLGATKARFIPCQRKLVVETQTHNVGKMF